MPLWAGILVGTTLGGGVLAFGLIKCKQARKRAIKELRAQGELLPHKAAERRGPGLDDRRSDAFRRTMTRIRTMRFNLEDLKAPPAGARTISSGDRRRSSASAGGSGSGRGRRTSASAPPKLGRGSTPPRGVGKRIPSFEELGRASTRR
jgi:hypothetical protein